MLYENDDRVKQNEINKNNSINKATEVYDNLMHNNEAITKQNEEYLDQYYDTNVNLANKTTDFNIDLINQQQKQAEKTYQNDMRSINSDYQKSINKYGVEAETMAQNGLNNSGYAEYTKVNKYTQAQEKLASTRANNEKAYQEFENQKSQARLENDSTIAQYGLDVLKQKLEAQLEEFQYNSDILQNKLSTTQSIESDYYSRYMDIVNQANWEKEQEEAKRQYNENLSYQKSQDKIANALAEKYYQLSKKYS